MKSFKQGEETESEGNKKEKKSCSTHMKKYINIGFFVSVLFFFSKKCFARNNNELCETFFAQKIIRYDE